MYKKILVIVLLFSGCKIINHKTAQKNRLPLREDGFYFRKDHEYTTDEYLLLKFYSTKNVSELIQGGGIDQLNTDPHQLVCYIDNNLSKLPPIIYKIKADSIFFKKKAWDSYEYDSLSFACKVYGDSIVARVTPMAYFEANININPPNKSYIVTYKFKQAFCDTIFLREMKNAQNQR